MAAALPAVLFVSLVAWAPSPRPIGAPVLGFRSIPLRVRVVQEAAKAVTQEAAGDEALPTVELAEESELAALPEASIEEPAGGPPEEDQTKAAIDYFASERVPAALIGGATVSLFFSYPLSGSESVVNALAKRLYIIFITSSLCNSLVAVFSSSLAITRLLGGVHSREASTPTLLLLREVPLYFLAVRVHFLSGLLTFTAAIGVRTLAEYGLGHPHFARGLVFMLAGAMTFMIAMYNVSLIHFKSFAHLWVTYINVLKARLLNRSPRFGNTCGLLAFIAAAFVAASFGELLYVVIHFGSKLGGAVV